MFFDTSLKPNENFEANISVALYLSLRKNILQTTDSIDK